MIYGKYPNYKGFKEMSSAGVNISWFDEGICVGMKLIAEKQFKTDIRKRNIFCSSRKCYV